MRHFACSTLSQKCHIHKMTSHNNPWPSCGSTSTTQSEFTRGCSVRALARAGVPRPLKSWRITCERSATGLGSKPGKRWPLNWWPADGRATRVACAENPVHLRPLQQSCNRTHIQQHALLARRILAVTEGRHQRRYLHSLSNYRTTGSGLHTGTVVFDTLPKIEMRMRCPACHKNHWWNCTRAWVIESTRPC